MAGYTKEFLIECFVSRYYCLGKEIEEKQRALAIKTYDEFGRDKFRVYASLDAEAIREAKKYI